MAFSHLDPGGSEYQSLAGSYTGGHYEGDTDAPEKFVLTIRLGGNAMRTGEDVAGALRFAAENVESISDFSLLNDDETPEHILDINGKPIGEWEIK